MRCRGRETRRVFGWRSPAGRMSIVVLRLLSIGAGAVGALSVASPAPS